MIDWLKFAPLQLSSTQETVEFKGPNFKNSRQYQLKVADNTIRFKCPKHSTRLDGSPFYLKDQDCIDQMHSAFDHIANDNWHYIQGFFSSWDFRKSWFRGSRGNLSMTFSIICREEQKAFTNVSFFHPRSFEYALTLYLHARFGVETPHTYFENKGPLNWTSHNSLPVPAASFDIHPSSSFFVFPITPQYLAEFEFFYIGEGDDIKKEMKELALDILNSVQVELSEKTKTLIKAVKKSCPDFHLTQNFAPLKWPIKKENIEKTADLEKIYLKEEND